MLSPDKSHFNEKFFSFSSTESSDSESFLEEDISNNDNHINKQWDAIERTLYQEAGQQVTDSELLKECKLWRDTFPHFRIRGTKIDVEKKSTDDNVKINTKKLKEKRESIKNKVVGELVERLIAKFKDLPAKAVVEGEKESYFERGKPPDEGLTKTERHEKLTGVFDDWEKQSEIKLPETPAKQIIVHPRHKPSDSLSNMVKPFQPRTKIDKKYEGLLEKIMERRCSTMHPPRNCLTSSSCTHQERFKCGEYNRSRNLPRINRFNNNWLERGEMHCFYYGDDNFSSKTSKDLRGSKKKSKELSLYRENMTHDQIDEKFMEELKKEMYKSYKRPPRKSGLLEEISVRRPQPIRQFEAVEKTQKSSSCGDLPKKSKKTVKSRQLKSNMEGEANAKSRARTTNLSSSQSRKINGGKTSLLPPIENSIICTELSVRPKVGGPRNPKKY